MTRSDSLSTPVPNRGALPLLWSQTLAVAPRGLAPIREKGGLLAWDDKHWLHLLNRQGERQGQMRPQGAVTAVCAAEDGSAFAAGGSQGEVWWLAPDLKLRWEKVVPDKVTATAMDPFGQYLAVADGRGNLHIFDRDGRRISQTQGPRPFQHLAFVPAAPFLVGSADFGLVACLDLAGQWVWRDGLVAHTGALAVNGEGEQILLACFTEGLRRYGVKGRAQGRLPVAEPCRLVAQSFDGSLILVADLTHHLLLLDRAGRTLYTHSLESPAVALALSALGDSAVVALTGDTLVCLDLRPALRG